MRLFFNICISCYTLKVMPDATTLSGNEENVALISVFWWSLYVTVVTSFPWPSKKMHGMLYGI